LTFGKSARDVAFSFARDEETEEEEEDTKDNPSSNPSSSNAYGALRALASLNATATVSLAFFATNSPPPPPPLLFPRIFSLLFFTLAVANANASAIKHFSLPKCMFKTLPWYAKANIDSINPKPA
jgi:hypothetical protein